GPRQLELDLLDRLPSAHGQARWPIEGQGAGGQDQHAIGEQWNEPPVGGADQHREWLGVSERAQDTEENTGLGQRTAVVERSTDDMIRPRQESAGDGQATAAPLVERGDRIERARSEPDALERLMRDIALDA